MFRAQHGQVLRGIGLLHSEAFDERARRQFALAEQLDDGDASGVGQRLEELGFEASLRNPA